MLAWRASRKFLMVWALWLCALLPASGQWMFEKAPAAKGSSFELAHNVPADASTVVGFSLQGQLDFVGIASDITSGMRQSKDGAEVLADFEARLGSPVPQWLSMFTGRGFMAYLPPSKDEEWTDSVVVALQVEKPELVGRWLAGVVGRQSKSTEISGYRISQFGSKTRFGLGKGWAFLANTDASSERLIASLDRRAPSLAGTANFRRAQDSLTGGDSGLFLYADGDGIRRGLFDYIELPEDHAAAREFGFWDFAVLSADFAQPQTDAFLGYTPRASELLSALRQPGTVSAELIDLVPAGQNTLNAADGRWLAEVVNSFGSDVPDLGFLLIMARAKLAEYGDFDQAFVGPVVVGSNLLDAFAATLRRELYVGEEDPNRPAVPPDLSEPSMFVAAPVRRVDEAHNLMLSAEEANSLSEVEDCSGNISKVGSAADLYREDHQGSYPKSIEQLVPDYISEVPPCPAAGKDTYSASFKPVVVGDKMAGVTLFCQGHHHPELQPDKPLYDPGEGVVTGPVEKISRPRTAAPGAGETRAYAVTDGPRAVLDNDKGLLRLVYGPKGADLLERPSGEMSRQPGVAEALHWGEDRLIYLDYLDLQSLYSAFEESAHAAAEQGDDDAIAVRAILRRLRPRLGALEGSSCLKVTDGGLHYRSSGIGTGQTLTAGLLVYAISLPGEFVSGASSELAECELNLKNIGTALEIWSTDNSGKFPGSLDQLTPDYLPQIPLCPAAGVDTYSDTYSVRNSKERGFDVFELYCKGHHHAAADAAENQPRYTSDEGILKTQ